MKADIPQLKEALIKEQGRLERSLQNIAKPDPKNPENWRVTYPELTDRGTKGDNIADENADEVEEFGTRLETEDALEDRLREVNRALEKIENGGYGICENCANSIPAERLAANPAARFDMEHAGD
ncbi:MAG: hypothetical protein HY220_01540 [Candidatus Sungbacteria bacterium]|uniref:DksA C4-type domain-containing protein n=1 Tax=Candidatus Sungiibacteriota bacterium TaxID=2750080 RepID=A0A9D6LSS2_9BACT|nr:hypothetical protein [Candidatus Sungbacteria bacterium]